MKPFADASKIESKGILSLAVLITTSLKYHSNAHREQRIKRKPEKEVQETGQETLHREERPDHEHLLKLSLCEKNTIPELDSNIHYQSIIITTFF